MVHTRSKATIRMEKVGERVDVSRDVLGDVNYTSKELLPVLEGVHYKVLAYTDWADVFIPTIIKWNFGAVDDFDDKEKSFKNRKKALVYKKMM